MDHHAGGEILSMDPRAGGEIFSMDHSVVKFEISQKSCMCKVTSYLVCGICCCYYLPNLVKFNNLTKSLIIPECWILRF